MALTLAHLANLRNCHPLFIWHLVIQSLVSLQHKKCQYTHETDYETDVSVRVSTNS